MTELYYWTPRLVSAQLTFKRNRNTPMGFFRKGQLETTQWAFMRQCHLWTHPGNRTIPFVELESYMAVHKMDV